MRRVLMGCLAVTLFACGGPISIGDTDGGGGGGGGGGGSATSGYASISITETELSAQSYNRGFYGVFWPHGPSAAQPAAQVGWLNALPADCQVTTESVCAIARCGPYVVSSDAGVVGAGTLTFQGPGTNLTLGQNPMRGDYATSSPDAGAWSAGQTFTVTATGAPGGAPAFTASVQAPPRLSFTYPSAGAAVAFRGQPLPLAWQPAAGELAVLLISASPTQTTLARCTVAANVSNLNVPAAVTQALEVGMASMVLVNATESVSQVGDWSIHLQAATTQAVSVTVQ